jgi:succinoglycan biosynthesis transport protein ExoP
MKELSPYSQQRVVLLEPEDAVSNWRRVEMTADGPNLRDYWQVARKHQWKILACFVFAVVMSAVITFSTAPIYTARATLLIERKEPQVVNIQQVVSEAPDGDDSSYYASQYGILQSRSLAAEVIKAKGLDKNPEFTRPVGGNFISQLVALLWNKPLSWLTSLFEQSAPSNSGNSGDLSGVSSGLIDAYNGMLIVEPVKRSRLVNIAINSPNPGLAAQIANAHADAYIQQGFKLRTQASEEARKFLETKLAELRDRVEKSEKSLNDFRRGKGIISLDDKENIIVERLADLNKRLTEAEADRIGFEAQARLIKSRQYDSLPAVIGNGLIQSLRGQIVQLEAEHAKLSEQYLPGYPRLAQVKAQLEESRARLGQQIKNVVEGINSAYLAAAGKERELRAQMDKQKSATFELKDASVEYSILAREATTNKSLYDSVLERFKQINITAGIPPANVSILDRAEIPRQPSKPNKRLNLMLGALLGLMGGLGLALILEHLNNTLSTPEEVEHYLGLPNLVVVPDFFSLPKNASKLKIPFSARSAPFDSKLCVPSKSPVTANLRFTLITEAYRKLRTSILYSRPGQAPKAILFTSSSTGEGKTISVANTAIMFAQLGYNCLVIDADLRRPSCHRALRVENDRGLTEFLVGREDLRHAIKPTSVANLSVLNCGSIAPNPSELIGSQRMLDALNELKNQYDFILIDSPPVMPVSDAVILATMVDGVVFVVRGQETPKQLVKVALSQLKTDHTRVLGVLLNRVDLRRAEYANYYQYDDDGYYSSMKLT